MPVSRRAASRAAWVALAAWVSSAAHADEGPEITVIARLGSATVLTAGEAELAIRRVAGGVDVVDADDFADRFAVNFRDMLAFSPGVFAQNRYGEEVRLSIRGSGIGRNFHLRGVTLLVDGAPINLADGSGDFQEIDPLALSHIEVWRGANALRFGSGSLGGAINAVTPSGRTARSPVELRLEGGSFGTLRAHAAAAWAGEASDAFAAVTYMTDDGYRRQSAQDKLRFTGNVGLRLSDTAETRFYLTANRLDQEVPGSIMLAEALEDPRAAPAGNIANRYARDIRSLRVQNRTSVALGAARLEAGAFANVKSLYHPIFQAIDQDSTDWGGFARIEGATGPLGYSLGTNLRYGRVDAKQFRNVGGRRGALTADAEQTARTLDAYGELRAVAADGLTLIGGLLFTSARRELDNRLNPTASDARTYDLWSPKLGLLWEPAADVQVYANLGRAAEAPTFSEVVQAPILGFVPLDAQRGWTTELGTRGRHGPLAWDVTLYRADLRGELLPFTVDQSIPATTFNAGHTRHQGIEAGLDWTLAEGVMLRQVYQLNDFRFQGDRQYGDNRLPAVPRHLYRAELRLARGGLTVTPNLEWVPDGAWADYANSLRAPGYALVGLQASATVSGGIELFLDARNLTNKRAVGDIAAVIAATPSSAIYYPVEGRALFGGLTLRFGGESE